MIDINDAINLACKKILNNKSFINLNISKAVGEILSQDIIAQKDLPCFDNSALDGYAFSYRYIKEPLEILDPVIFAGDKNIYELNGAKCYKIMTGALFPKGCDSVARVEDVTIKDGMAYIPLNTKKFDAHRLKGEEVKKGEILLKKGEILTPSKIMLLASQGINSVNVFKKPKIAVFSSGDEIMEPWEKASEFEIYNANSSGIEALLKKEGFQSEYKGIIKDNLETTINAFANCNDCDIIITSGGASAGDKDYMLEALQQLGYEIVYEFINVRPGKPSKCFSKDGKFVFVLPGNPMAAYLLCFLTIIPVVKKIAGYKEISHQKILAEFSGNLKIKPNRSNLILGIYENGKFCTVNDNKFGSGMITPIVKSNAIFISEFKQSELKNGQIVEILRMY